jgi:hypothetical protein
VIDDTRSRAKSSTRSEATNQKQSSNKQCYDLHYFHSFLFLWFDGFGKSGAKPGGERKRPYNSDGQGTYWLRLFRAERIVTTTRAL